MSYPVAGKLQKSICYNIDVAIYQLEQFRRIESGRRKQKKKKEDVDMVARDKGNVTVALSDKRLLSMDEFAIYTSMGVCKTRELAELSGALFRAGKRVLVDRVKFDRWCDKNNEV